MLGAARVSSGLVARRWRAGERVVAVWRVLRPFLGTVAGLACFVVAAFMWSVIAGIMVTGVACFVLDWYADTDVAQARRRQ